MPIIEYNAVVDLGTPGPSEGDVDALMDGLAPYHVAVAASRGGTTEVILTLRAANLAQASATALAVCERASGREPRAVEVMTTEDFDRLYGLTE